MTDDDYPIPGSAALRTTAIASIPRWLEQCVRQASADVTDDEIHAAGRVAAEVVGRELDSLFRCEPHNQLKSPLQVLREAVRFPTEVLSSHRVPAVPRDAFAQRNFPHDVYNLTPASFADVHADLHDVGLAWGAAKAWLHLRGRGRGGDDDNNTEEQKS